VSAQNEAERLARAWIGGWNAGKPDEIPLARDFTHASPFSVVSGREKYLAWVKPLAARNVVSLNIVKTLGGDSESVIWFDDDDAGRTGADVRLGGNGRDEIVAVTSFYDASHLRKSQQNAG